MYKYIGNEDSISALKHTNSDTPMRSFSNNLKPDIKTRRIFKMCNPPEDITIGNEGKYLCSEYYNQKCTEVMPRNKNNLASLIYLHKTRFFKLVKQSYYRP
jgi:hypothetical protein